MYVMVLLCCCPPPLLGFASLFTKVAACVIGCPCVFFQAEDGIRDLVRSRGLGDVYKRQVQRATGCADHHEKDQGLGPADEADVHRNSRG